MSAYYTEKKGALQAGRLKALDGLSLLPLHILPLVFLQARVPLPNEITLSANARNRIIDDRKRMRKILSPQRFRLRNLH
ncbi:hypothetical protein A2765_05590 [Candidatus Kaiserbacteria bacterium RIFCSPHIGHO2_01_FULL_56_24]|uniref:Uncharacterized protein n=1 Tax=Candidatus Kaiserbacteria bacterium RIFCSPHIGHO2_01_FULL_56_24 TaxID=1798487 RepID=A0A1F6DBI3_9BACT|nr:MAG: hypothetical protein A2765_05590 [Candidatus Kaiserbacteria bacterium RIFCSPHIGHO2_01_FULL_56_24]